jgi:hypothetical protein
MEQDEMTTTIYRPMNDVLEALLDKHGMSKLLFALAEICHGKAEHVSVNWQDKKLASEWVKDALDIEKLAGKIRNI